MKSRMTNVIVLCTSKLVKRKTKQPEKEHVETGN